MCIYGFDTSSSILVSWMLRSVSVAGGAILPVFNVSLISRQRRSVIKVCCLFVRCWSRRIRCASRALYAALCRREHTALWIWYVKETYSYVILLVFELPVFNFHIFSSSICSAEINSRQSIWEMLMNSFCENQMNSIPLPL